MTGLLAIPTRDDSPEPFTPPVEMRSDVEGEQLPALLRGKGGQKMWMLDGRRRLENEMVEQRSEEDRKREEMTDFRSVAASPLERQEHLRSSSRH